MHEAEYIYLYIYIFTVSCHFLFWINANKNQLFKLTKQTVFIPTGIISNQKKIIICLINNCYYIFSKYVWLFILRRLYNCRYRHLFFRILLKVNWMRIESLHKGAKKMPLSVFCTKKFLSNYILWYKKNFIKYFSACIPIHLYRYFKLKKILYKVKITSWNFLKKIH